MKTIIDAINYNFLPEVVISTFILLFLIFLSILKITKYTVTRGKWEFLNTFIFYLLCIILGVIWTGTNETETVLYGLLIHTEFIKYMKLFLVFTTLCCIGTQKNYLIKQKIFLYEKNLLLLISLLGMMLLISACNFVILYLAIEMQSLCFYILTATKKKSIVSAEAALKYLILGVISSCFILMGSSILYITYGSFSFNEITLLITNCSLNDPLILYGSIFGGIFIIGGLLFKIGAVPFHFWLPDIYEGAPNNITAFFSIVPKIAFITFLIKFYFQMLNKISNNFIIIFCIVSAFSMLVGSLGALQQKKVKRFLAYGSISHVGFILLSFLVEKGKMTVPFIYLYIIAYILSILNIWIILNLTTIEQKPIKFLTDLAGAYSKNLPITLIFIISCFSLAGIPPLAGFVAKFVILENLFYSKYQYLAIIAIFSSIISAIYYIRFIKIIFFEKKTKNITIDVPFLTYIILLINTFFIISFIVYSEKITIFISNIYNTFIL